ncbi:DNA repair protein RecO [Candidatus Termititenax persephonae]|uniref:DNA repair protein RecO n=1 Tax=Candidatus Termititenax persephonae TaxID=2218525 RepID=A0A388TG37_9BACT|nr:DNA repair protein RecO [Candidatus Termititenax persephonae]
MSARLEGIILRKKIWHDNDLLLSVFSLSEGRIKLVQPRGFKKTRAELDLFCRSEFIVSDNKDFALIYQTSGLDLFSQIRQDYTLLQAAAEAVQTIEKITSSLQPNPELYQLLLDYLRTFKTGSTAAELTQRKTLWQQNILRSEGIYSGQKISEKSFWQTIEAYRG